MHHKYHASGKMKSPNPKPVDTPAEADLAELLDVVPPWVKGMVAIAGVLFLIQLPTFPSSLSDTIQKNQAERAYRQGQYGTAIEQFSDLLGRYPRDFNIKRQLGLSQHGAGQYREAIATFDQLVGVEMSKGEVEEIRAAIFESKAKLKSGTN